MDLLEFKTKAKNGVVKIPVKFQKFANSTVKIVFLESKNSISKKDKLRSLFVKAQENEIFSSIENPVQWQKELRNEWE